MAEHIKHLTNKQVLVCLKILNSDDIQAFSEKFLEELHARYSQPEEVKKLISQDGNPFFLEFSQNWPIFLYNHLLIDGLINLSSDVKEQSTALKILATKKNIVHPTLI